VATATATPTVEGITVTPTADVTAATATPTVTLAAETPTQTPDESRYRVYLPFAVSSSARS
jgi:hypothetical protein